jgi:S-adenosylhomocysteine hydrolase
MSSGLFSGASGLSLGTGLYKAVSSLWSGASSLLTGFGDVGPPTAALLLEDGAFLLLEDGSFILLE